jgi:hypothetical protein
MYRYLNFFVRGWKLQIGGVIMLLYTGGFGSAAIGGAAIVAQELLASEHVYLSELVKSEGLFSSAF